jgi:hypothetical protein
MRSHRVNEIRGDTGELIGVISSERPTLALERRVRIAQNFSNSHRGLALQQIPI